MASKKKRSKKRKGGKKRSGKGGQRPLKFLKAMHAKMERNLPKLEALIKKREGRG
jgi:hypothetical protein